MMNHFLLDAAPEPISAGIGIAGLLLVGVVVFMLTAAILLGAVFLFNRLRKAPARPTRLAVGDVCLNLDNATAESNPQADTSN